MSNNFLMVLVMFFASATAVWSMGPDPGGHTGAGVTPETTKTDRPEVDAARKAASGNQIESPGSGTQSNTPTAQPSSKADKKSKPAN